MEKDKSKKGENIMSAGLSNEKLVFQFDQKKKKPKSETYFIEVRKYIMFINNYCCNYRIERLSYIKILMSFKTLKLIVQFGHLKEDMQLYQ